MTPTSLPRPRVAFLGANSDELAVFAALHRAGTVELVGIYDPNPRAIGLAMAQLIDVPAGSTESDRARLRNADFIVAPQDRARFSQDVEWYRGSGSELLSPEDAVARWGGTASSAVPSAERTLADLERLAKHLDCLPELAQLLLDLCMRLVGATGGSLQLVAARAPELYIVAARGLSDDTVRHGRRLLGEPIAGLAASLREPQLVHGMRAHHVHADRGHIESALSLPLASPEGDLVAVLNVSTYVEGHQFDADDIARLQVEAPRIAALLVLARSRDALQGEASLEALIATMREIEPERHDLMRSMSQLVAQLRRAFEATQLGVFLVTEDGDWLPLGNDSQAGGTNTAFGGSRAMAARAYLERSWLQRRRPAAPPATPSGDEIDVAVEAVLRADASSAAEIEVYAPLIGTQALGVLAASFTELAKLDRFVRRGQAHVHNLALFAENRLREQRAQLRVQRMTRLAHALPALVGARRAGTFESEVARQARHVLAAERAIFRWVDESKREFSAPVSAGIPDAALDAWRTVDAQVTERTLQERKTVLVATTAREPDALTEPLRYRSMLSVPILSGKRIVGLLNVYDKLPQDVLDGTTFSDADSRLLEDFVSVVAAMVVAPDTDAAHTAQPRAQENGADAQQEGGSSQPP